MLGRAWHYALAGLGPQGVRHLIHLLSDDMVVNMGMLGAHSLSDLRGDLMRPSP
jgi:L-lactate dehydrogenase (cytochrome)